MTIDNQVVATTEPSAEDTSVQVTQDEANVQSEGTPEAAQDNGEKSQELNAEDTVTEQLFAGKFKTQEELEKGYKELESKFGQTSQEKAELSKFINDAFATQDAQTSGNNNVNDDFDDYGTTRSVQPSPEDIKRDIDMATMKFLLTHESVDGKALNEVLKNDPIVSDINGFDNKLEYAYLRTQSMTQSKAIEEASKKASQDTQTKIIEKQAAQVEAPTKSEPSNPKAELREKAIKGDQSARLEYLKSIL